MTDIPGLPGYHRAADDLPKTTPQTVFPKSQGPPIAPADAPAPISALPGYKRATPTGTPANTQGDGTWSGLAYDIVHPQPADLNRPQTWRDWVTKTYSPSASDVGRAALDDVSFGTADYARSKLTGENIGDLRARTADAQAAMGPMGPVVNALTYAVPGAGVARGLETIGAAGKVAGTLGRYGAGALEGATVNAASSAGHQAGDPNGIDPLKVAKDAGTGAVFGVGGQAAGDAAAAAVRNVSNYVRGSPGRSGEAWNWRERAAAGDPTLPSDVANQQVFRAPNDPAQPALAKVQDALAQSTDPGVGFNTLATATGAGASALGVNEGLGWVESLTPGGVAGFATSKIGQPIARGVNTLDRNINVGQALDQAYPALYGPFSTPALDTSGWANAIRRGTIGGERPADQTGDAQWW
jgi:hypothetical protein